MPITTRSQQGSAPPSESGETSGSAGGLTPAEVEIINRRIAEKEKLLKEQSEALKRRQEELDKIRYEVESGQGTSTGPDSELKERMIRLERAMDTLTVLPEQLDELRRQIPQSRSGRDTPDFQQGSTQLETSPIRLKDVIDSVPKYDGHNMSVFHFCKMCERASQLIPQYHEFHLVQLIMNKLQGHAYAAVEGYEYPRIFYLTRRLKQIFGPNKSTDQYRGELANIYMKPNEHILDYAGRVKELANCVIDGEMGASGYIETSARQLIEHNARDSFINGLPSDLLIRVRLREINGCLYTLEDAIAAAVQITKTLEAEKSRKQNTNCRFSPPFRADTPFNRPSAPNRASESGLNSPRSAPVIKPLVPGQPGPNYPGVICFYCKTPGHVMKNCYRLAYKNKINEENATKRVLFKQGDSGNAMSIPEVGVRRDANQTGRPSTSIMISQETNNPPHTLPI